jgi:hypothetical protein
MAFFDIDRRIQTLIIAGALASMSACSGGVSLDGAADTAGPDHVDDPPHIDVDPLPDVLDPDLSPDPPEACPEPSGWEMEVTEGTLAWPSLTLRVSVNLHESFIGDATVDFTAERMSVDEVRRISDSVYEIDYRWIGPVDPWGSWDRLRLSWHIVCHDDEGTHERTLEEQRILCISPGMIWLSWSSDPDDCMMVDPPPPPPDGWSAEIDGDTGGPGAIAPLLPKGVLRAGLRSTLLPDGSLRLRVEPRGSASAMASYTWTASGGLLESSGREALWFPPVDRGVHVVQVLSRSGPALSVDVLRHEV